MDKHSLNPATLDLMVKMGVYMEKNNQNCVFKIPQQEYGVEHGKMSYVFRRNR